MTPDDIRTAIQADQALQALIPDTQAIADALSAERTRFVPTEIGVGMIIESLGLATGNTVLDAVLGNPDFRHIKPLLEHGRLRLDSPFVRGVLASLVGTLITQEQHDALIVRAQAPDPVSEMDVRRALWSDDGSYLL